MRINLSFTTLNATINSPHTYINKMMGLPTFSTQDFESGKKIHRVVQEHVSGVKQNDLLADLPLFSLVEKVDFDDDMRIEYVVSDKYVIIGFADGKDPERKEILEIKSGRVWTAGDFARSPQWKIYGLALPDYKKIWLVSLPKDQALWRPESIRIYNKEITQQDRNEALDFINKGINVIEHIDDFVEQEAEEKKKKGWTGRSRWCYYQECQWCV